MWYCVSPRRNLLVPRGQQYTPHTCARDSLSSLTGVDNYCTSYILGPPMLRHLKSETLSSRETRSSAPRERRVAISYFCKKKYNSYSRNFIRKKMTSTRRSRGAELRVSRNNRVSNFERRNMGGTSATSRHVKTLIALTTEPRALNSISLEMPLTCSTV